VVTLTLTSPFTTTTLTRTIQVVPSVPAADWRVLVVLALSLAAIASVRLG